MTWVAGNFFIGPGEAIGYVFGFDNWPGLQFILARPYVHVGVKLKTEPFSITLDQVTVVDGVLNGRFTYYTVVTNQSNQGTWFSFVGNQVG